MVLGDGALKLIFSFVSGSINGMGLGGGMILIPMLTMMDVAQKEAQLINLMCYVPISLFISIANCRKGIVNKEIWKNVLIFAIVGGAIGSIVAINADSGILRKILGVIMVIIGISQIKKCIEKDL